MKISINEWTTTERLTQLETWARAGLTDRQIAHNIGISRKTLFNWQKNEALILHALKKGRAVADYYVENALHKRAVGYTTKERRIEIAADGTKKYVEVTKEVPPDVTACIFWLKNRKREMWRDRPIQEVDTEDSEAYFAAAGLKY